MANIPFEAPVADIVKQSSPLAKGMALVLAVLILSLGALLYFNKEYFADLRDYRVTIAELRAEIKYAEKERAAMVEVTVLLRAQIAGQAQELDDLRSQLAALKSKTP